MTGPAVSTCLWFTDQAEAAARFYVSLIPGSAITRVFRNSGDPQSTAFMVDFTLAGQAYAAMNGGPIHALSPAASVVVHLDTQVEVDHLWDALLEGGAPNRCGWLTDRYGLSWQIIPRALPRLLLADPSGRVVQAMMGMVKIDIAALEAAFAG